VRQNTRGCVICDEVLGHLSELQEILPSSQFAELRDGLRSVTCYNEIKAQWKVCGGTAVESLHSR
jgi:hypothetical protein